ncbi:MAG: putative lipopolysaccharide heptosyltransferase III [Betaproteobacteria bacterium]|nr:putative lipopolysaccharide heptosyltransferase III [Betaproteobacteria bacterium]
MVDDAVPLSALHRVLVIKLRHHGDVLLTSPVLSVLKRHIPEAEIDALLYQDTAPMLALHPALAQVHTIDRGWRRLGVRAHMRAEWNLFSRLRARRYDLLVHLTEHPRGAWLSHALGARFRVGPRRPGASRWWRDSFSHLYATPGGMPRHTVERNLDALRRIGIHPGEDERRLVLVPGDQAEARAEALLREHGLEPGRFVHLHPASRWLFKCWPAQYNALLAGEIARLGLKVVVTSAPDSRERAMIDDILRLTAVPVVNLAGHLDLKELAALTARARLFVGVDSAPMHIAAAMGTPAVALFGPSGDIEWGPWQVAHRVVASDRHPCRPCGLDGCGGGKLSECLTTLPVERVMAAVRELLATP